MDPFFEILVQWFMLIVNILAFNPMVSPKGVMDLIELFLVAQLGLIHNLLTFFQSSD